MIRNVDKIRFIHDWIVKHTENTEMEIGRLNNRSIEPPKPSEDRKQSAGDNKSVDRHSEEKICEPVKLDQRVHVQSKLDELTETVMVDLHAIEPPTPNEDEKQSIDLDQNGDRELIETVAEASVKVDQTSQHKTLETIETEMINRHLMESPKSSDNHKQFFRGDQEVDEKSKQKVFKSITTNQRSQSKTNEKDLEFIQDGSTKTIDSSLSPHSNNDRETVPATGDNGDQDKFIICYACNNRMPARALSKHIQRKHVCDVPKKLPQMQRKPKKQAKVENGIRCKICSALMHADYMAYHVLRRHNTNGAIGILSTQYTDDEINERIEQGCVFVKDSIVYIEQ